MTGGTSGCPTGKLGHYTRHLAHTFAHRIHPGQHLRPYLCRACGCWHLGHLPPVVLSGDRSAAAVYR